MYLYRAMFHCFSSDLGDHCDDGLVCDIGCYDGDSNEDYKIIWIVRAF